VRDLGRIRLVVAAYREHGVRFAIDDVGEGHSTVELLVATNPDYIKISGSLTARVGDSGPYSAIQAALAFASTSRAEVIAEAWRRPTWRISCARWVSSWGQGYLLGLAAPAEEHAQVQRISRVRQQSKSKTGGGPRTSRPRSGRPNRASGLVT